MAKRTVCLCDGKYIGIETIYTIIDGKQINIPEKVKELRIKSQNNELFCPCGCGTNVILVAGDRNLREQHFRMKEGTTANKCTIEIEGKTSIDSKIVLKCWLDDKIKDVNLESRVPISDVGNTDRKYEISFLSRGKNIVISYCNYRSNLSEEKMELIKKKCDNMSIFYIVDFNNGGCNGQYPEALMKIQKRQGFCLLLRVNDISYDEAFMKTVYYIKDLDGFWRERTIAQGSLSEYDFDINGQMLFNGNLLVTLKGLDLKNFDIEMQHEQNERKKQRKKNEEKKIELREEYRKREELKKRYEQIILEQKKKNEELEKSKIEEYKKKTEEFKMMYERDFSQQEKIIKDADGNRWVQCECCGKKAKESDFLRYGGSNHVNLGVCNECYKKGRYKIENTSNSKSSRENDEQIMKIDSSICPVCGGRLKQRKGPYGDFIGCSNYPKCRYTKKSN